MVKKSHKLYKKAVQLYHDGNINKAMDICEKSVSLDIRNSAALNLKGLLNYLKGDLDEARRIWEINYKANSDNVSRKYLDDTKKDRYNQEMINKAVQHINKLEITEALTILEECRNSHYNIINVNNYLTVCYIKKGDFEKAIDCINQVLKIDKVNEIAYENRKTLVKYGILKRNNNKVIKICTLIIVLSILLLGIKTIINKVSEQDFSFLKQNKISLSKNQKNNEKNEQLEIEKDELTNEDNEEYIDSGEDTQNNMNSKELKDDQKDNSETIDKKIDKEFPFNEIQILIGNKDYYALYDNIIDWDDKSLDINEKALINKAKDLMQMEAGEFFYFKGLDLIENEEDYSQALEYFLKGLDYCKTTYLYQHDLYLLAVCYEEVDDIENALKFYEIYNDEYDKQEYISEGVYIESVLYRLAILYRGIDDEKSIQYAQKLISNYPDSDYNNFNIERIIQNKK